MRIAAITPSTAAQAAPPPDRFDPAGDGGFATALSDVMRPAIDARPSAPKPPERPREVQPAARSEPPASTDTDTTAQDTAAAAADTATKAAARVEAIAETAEAAGTAVEISLIDSGEASEPDEKPTPKTAGAKQKKTADSDAATPPAAPLMPQASLHDAPAAETTTQTSGIAAGSATAGSTGDIAALTAAAMDGVPDEAPATADQPAAEAPSAPAFAQELARQTGQTAASRIDAPQPPSAPVAAAPAEQVAVKLAAAANGKGDRIRIQLSPEALGKVDVQLELGEDGHVQAVIRADKPETLHLLMHDAKHLLRGLQDAGFQASASNLQFSLSGDGDGRRQPGYADTGEQTGTGARADAGVPAELPRAYRTLGRAAHGGIDLSI